MFQGIAIHNEPSFRPRPKSVAGYHKFSQGKHDIFVTEKALEQIAREARRASPNETIGYLLGRPFRDDQGVYAFVTEAITATSARRDRAAVETTLDDEQQLIETLLANHPISEKLGWFHSHPFPLPTYSGTDAENQQFWREPYHLGLLATLENTSDAVKIHAFRGPEAERMQPSYTADGRFVDRVADSVAEWQLISSSSAANHLLSSCYCRQQPPRYPFSLTTANVFTSFIWPIVYLLGVWMFIQAAQGTPQQPAKDLRNVQPATGSKRIESLDGEGPSSRQSDVFPPEGGLDKPPAKIQDDKTLSRKEMTSVSFFNKNDKNSHMVRKAFRRWEYYEMSRKLGKMPARMAENRDARIMSRDRSLLAFVTRWGNTEEDTHA